jgi:hypothetical protein
VLDGRVFDCVPVDQQPGIVRQGLDRLPAPPPNAPSPGAARRDADDRAEEAGGGHVCAAGRVPIRRVTLEDVTRFAMLRDFLGKAPAGRAPMAPTDGAAATKSRPWPEGGPFNQPKENLDGTVEAAPVGT